jgi:ABC-type uncharacterized transport system permease subunit
MEESLFVQTIATVVAASSPLVFAGIGETLTEKAGIVNLSLDGSILLAAMAAFAVSMISGSLLLGIVVAMGVGACIAWIVAYSSIALKQSQVAVGFVLTLLCADLSSFWGNPYVRKPGPSVPHWPVPGLVNIPVLGPMLFDQNILVYLSYLLIIGTWLWISRTQPGLRLRSVGERPEAAFSRGIAVNKTRYLYSLLGGALVGLAGEGWIALAIVIFGGWSPFRVALGAYLFGALKSLGSILQPVFPNVPTQVFQIAPFALMIVVLLLVSGGAPERIASLLPVRARRWLAPWLRNSAPAGLGKRFEAG